MEKTVVITVCNGNIYRSVIAQLCLSRELARIGHGDDFCIVSRGIQGTMGTKPPQFPNLRYYKTEYAHAEPYLKKIGIEIPLEQQATPIDKTIVEQSSLILAMDEKTLNSLKQQFPEHAFKTRLFMGLVGKREDVPDCNGSEDDDLHQQVVMAIANTSRAGINAMIYYARLKDIYSESADVNQTTKIE